MGDGRLKPIWSNHDPLGVLAAAVVPFFCQVTVKVTSRKLPLTTSETVRDSVIVVPLTSPTLVIAESNWVSIVMVVGPAASPLIVVQFENRNFSISWLMICAAKVWRRAVASISEQIVIAWIMPIMPATKIREPIIRSMREKPESARAWRERILTC